MQEISAPDEMASIKALVPDLAIVPKLLISSYLVIPIPVSQIVKVLFVLSGIILILKFGSVSLIEVSSKLDIYLYLILSKASDALEINSLKKISLFE